jgi:hypothetical protein
VIRGEGEVAWVKPFDPAVPTRPHGMGVRFTHLDDESRAVIDRALVWKERNTPVAPIAAYVRPQVAASVGELDQLAGEWGITPERIEATIARVRADRPKTDERELERLRTKR